MNFRKFIFNLLVASIPIKLYRKYARNLLDGIFPSRLQVASENAIAKELVAYIDAAKHNVKCSETRERSNVVWQYWGQGVENANSVVKCCFKSVDHVFSNKNWNGRIIRTDNSTIRDLLDIPESFFDKVSRGENGYSFAALSDLIRCGLLYKYGGIWLDASVYCSGFPDVLVNNERVIFERSANICTIERIKWMARSSYFRWGGDVRVNWLSSIIRAPKGDPLFGILYYALRDYWECESEYKNYFLAHIMFDFVKNRTNIINNYNYLRRDDIRPHELQFAINEFKKNDCLLAIANNYNVHKLSNHLSSEKFRSKISFLEGLISSS